MTDTPKHAGRPRTIGTVRVAVTLGREHLAYLRTVDGNRSAAVRRVIERDMQREQKQEESPFDIGVRWAKKMQQEEADKAEYLRGYQYGIKEAGK